MSSNQPYTLQDIQDRVNTLVDNSNDTPATTDDEWAVRLNLINQAIGKWEESDTLWRELYTTYTVPSTISTATTIALSTLTDMRYPGGWVELVSSSGGVNKYPLVSVEEGQSYDGDENIFWLSGNNIDGWTLNLGWTPVSGDSTYGATIKIPYYKYATRFTSASATTAKTEMSDPNFIVYDVAATKALLEGSNNQFSVFSTDANDAMSRMKLMNEAKAPFQINTTEDLMWDDYGATIGE